MSAATFDACKLLISNKKRNRRETKENEENLEKQPIRCIIEIRSLNKAFYLMTMT
jgi:hypothetical protein